MEPLDDNAIRKKKPRSAVFNNGYLCRIIVPCSGFLHFVVVTRDLSFDYIWKMNEKKIKIQRRLVNVHNLRELFALMC